MNQLTHIDKTGAARMVDVSAKADTVRTATAETKVRLSQAVMDAIDEEKIAKGDVKACVRLAGIQAAKKCSDLIPLCHPLPLSSVKVHWVRESDGIRIQAECKTTGKTGVEMEALTAASVAALCLYDMCKAMDKGIEIESTRLLSKTGGKSGDWSR